MVAIPCLDVSDSEVIHLDRDLAIGIQCGPRYKTKKVLNQQRSDLRENTKVCDLLNGLIFHEV